jgi:hypothetical protein
VQLPNLYKGQQLIVAGRYTTAQPVTVTFSGEAFGQPVAYTYTVTLADSSIDKNKFIQKIWAKKKIDNLLAIYQTLAATSSQALEFKNEITNYSMMYGIISPFTSFSGGGNSSTAVEEKGVDARNRDRVSARNAIRVYTMANGNSRLAFHVTQNLHKTIEIKIFNAAGRCVRTLTMQLNGVGDYEIVWNGFMDNGNHAPNDIYFCVINLGGAMLKSKIVLVR